MDAFLTDKSPAAFARVVDRLLASPHYGERWGRHWLDLVRYAETLGFEFDFDLHNAWRYRDYVIRAFNADLPYDQFVIEHLAGDLLPAPRRHPAEGFNESILATGFFWMGEARQTPIDIRQEQADVIDNQIDVFSKALLAQTVACARCHDHKFDAISTRDYYALVGYLKSSRYQQAFIDSPERITAKARELAALKTKIRGLIAVETAPAWLAALEKASSHLLAAAGQRRAEQRKLPVEQAERWIKALQQIDANDVGHPLHAWVRLAAAADYKTERVRVQATLRTLDAKTPRGAAPFEDFREESFAGWHVTGDAFGVGPARPGDIILGDRPEQPVGRFVSGGAHSGLLSNRLQGELRSRTFTIEEPFVHVRLAGRAARLNLVISGNTLIMNPLYGKLTIAPGGKDSEERELVWRTMSVERWVGQRAYIEISDSTIPMHRLSPPPSTLNVSEGPQDGYIVVDQIVFSNDPNPPTTAPNGLNLQALAQAKGDNLPALADAYQKLMIDEVKRWQTATGEPSDVSRRLSEDGTTLLNWLVQNGLLDCSKKQDAGKLADLLKGYRQIEASLPAPQRAPALADGTGENENVFHRGDYKALKELVPRESIGAALCGPAGRKLDDAGSGRLELARRLVNPSNPLIARVMVNRLWQHHFGQGIVRTPDDFGRMGQPPSHPELLDYLATEFVKHGWSIKKMHRMMVLSSTYQMSSQTDPAKERIDPENRLLSHMSIRRLEGEAIRDAILTVSGRLDRQMYGPSVLPYLTKHMEGRGRPTSGPLDGAGRRSIYLNVRRNFLTPMLVAFDYPTTFTTIGRRSVSSAPTQALTLMNDPFVVQAAERWAKRILAEPAKSAEERVDSLYRTAFARLPSESERRSALAFLQRQSERYGASMDEPPAWADLCHVLINVKEFIFLD